MTMAPIYLTGDLESWLSEVAEKLLKLNCSMAFIADYKTQARAAYAAGRANEHGPRPK